MEGASAPHFRGLRSSSERASKAARAASRKRDTACELALRRALWRLGLRYRVDVATLPGRPDVVFPKARLAVFCDGDFWHGRALDQRLSRLAAGHNASYWVAKVRTNVARDVRHTQALEADGWRVMRLWEGDIRRDPEGSARAVAAVLREV